MIFEALLYSTLNMSIKLTSNHGSSSRKLRMQRFLWFCLTFLHVYIWLSSWSISLWYLEALHTGTQPNSLDLNPRSGFNVVSREVHMACGRALNCWTAWISRTVPEHRHAVQHAARIRIAAVRRQSGLWIRIPDLHRIRLQGLLWRAPFDTAIWKIIDSKVFFLKYTRNCIMWHFLCAICDT